MIEAGSIAGFPDALRFVQALAALGWPMAVASSSKNANGMMRLIRLDSGQSLLDVFSANVCGRELPRGKPDPAIFLLAAAGLHVEPTFCFVAEDAPAGIEAARAGKMTALVLPGIATRPLCTWRAPTSWSTVLMTSLSMNWLTTGRAGWRHDPAGDEGPFPGPG